MKIVLLALALALMVSWMLWQASLARLWRWLDARPSGHFPVWKKVRERLDFIARRERLPQAQLWILPEFSPNVLVLARGKRVHLAATEGLLRALDNEELDAVLALSLIHVRNRRRRLQSWLALQLFPFARLLQSYPAILQLFISPCFTLLLRLAAPPSIVRSADKKAEERGDALVVAAALQKMAVLARKIPLRRWNIALDPLFLLSPLALDGGPFWVFLSQPSVEERCEALLTGTTCESAAGLP